MTTSPTQDHEGHLDTAVRRSIVVEAPVARAFEFFTRDIAKWWDPNKHLLQEPLAEMVFEPYVGGNIIDRGVSGAESRWATVLIYEPPTNLAFSWMINLHWQIESDPTRCSEVHVTFTPEGETPEGRRRTRVDLEHRHLDRHGDGWEAMRDAVGSPNGWSLESFARAISA